MPPRDVFALVPRLATAKGPVLVALVGPNGAGKSTFYGRYLQGISLPFVNADLLARAFVSAGFPGGEEIERLAARLADKKRGDLVAVKASFITETVFSDPVGAKVRWLRDVQAAGYFVAVIFLCVDSAELTALRVQTRIAAGGHSVPPDKIAARYERMRKNVKAALRFVDFAVLVDNSSLEAPLRPVATTAKGVVTALCPPLPWWAAEVLPSKKPRRSQGGAQKS